MPTSSIPQVIVNEYIGGRTGLGDPAISGFFIDDYWCSNLLTPGCNDPVQGATEIDRYQQLDMGLTDADIKDLTTAWATTMGQVQAEILRKGGYTWSLMYGQSNANAAPTLISHSTCITELQAACNPGPDNLWQSTARLVGMTVNGSSLPQLKEDLAFFLLARGPFAWLGWGVWGMTWPFNPEPAHGELPPLPHGVPRPNEFDLDYGVPQGLCHRTAPGIFERKWSKAQIKLDCNAFTGIITPVP